MKKIIMKKSFKELGLPEKLSKSIMSFVNIDKNEHTELINTDFIDLGEIEVLHIKVTRGDENGKK